MNIFITCQVGFLLAASNGGKRYKYSQATDYYKFLTDKEREKKRRNMPAISDNYSGLSLKNIQYF